MKRFKKHKVKVEKPEASTSYSRQIQEYDLTYYIHDRVELMHQVFSVLRPKDLKSMAPECVRHISIDDLQELCTEELLGISSKRLCAILDGADPPSDTESSSESPERMETISLDSISSDEEILSETSKKSKKHKRHRRDSKSKGKKKKSKEPMEAEAGDAEQSRAARAGLTVLELLELQARARAIRAQLQQEQAAKQAAEPTTDHSRHSSDNEVEIKEEPAEVVEISSEDEKPKIEELREETSSKLKEKSTIKSKEQTALQAPSPEKQPRDAPDTHTVTKKVSDHIIIVPQVKQTRKIKLNRSKITVSVASNGSNDNTAPNTTAKEANKTKDVSKNSSLNNTVVADKTFKDKEEEAKKEPSKTNELQVTATQREVKTKERKKKQKKVKKANQDSDHDEITLQLSDTEKMDLLEDLDRKNFDKLSSSESEDSESSSSDSESQQSEVSAKISAKNSPEQESIKNDGLNKKKETSNLNKHKKDSYLDSSNVEILEETPRIHEEETVEKSNDEEIKPSDDKSQESLIIVEDVMKSQPPEQKNESNDSKNDSDKPIRQDITESNDNIEITSIKDLPVIEDEQKNESVSVNSSPVEETEIILDSPKPDINKQDSPKIDSNETCFPSNDNNKSNSPSIELQKDHSPAKESSRDSSEKNSEKQTQNLKISIQVSTSEQATERRLVQIENINSNRQDGTSGEGVEKTLSEGEVSDKGSTDIEAVDLRPEVVCISDDEPDKKSHKKKKKKEKKSKSKKSKKSKQDFREGVDQNFYKEAEENETDPVEDNTDEVVEIEQELISLEEDDCDDVYEILELSDDSSCYEVEGTTVFSKEPTTEEIEALSARIDEIDREDVVTEEEIREHERRNEQGPENIEQLENVSWKDRYLDSKKVKKVLTTSSIFNALRKKNRELKKKLEESKKKEEVVEEEKEETVESNLPLEEGSIEQFNTLQGSTKYVDPVPEATEKTDENGENENGEVVKNEEENKEETSSEVPNNAEANTLEVETPQVAKEIRKDAKQLLKMYKRLMKYNDMNKQKNPSKQKDPNKKKKKKSKKKNKDAVGAGINTI